MDLQNSTMNGLIDKKKEIKLMITKLWLNKKLELIVPIIEKYKDEYSISKMCEILSVARNSFYKALNKSELPMAKENKKLKEIINKIKHDNKGR